MGKIAKGLLGGILPTMMGGKAPKVADIAPLAAPKPVDTAPAEDITDESKKAKQARAALYATSGGIQGEEILSGGVSKRQSLLGN